MPKVRACNSSEMHSMSVCASSVEAGVGGQGLRSPTGLCGRSRRKSVWPTRSEIGGEFFELGGG